MVKKDSTLNLQMKDIGAEVFILQEMRVTVTITVIPILMDREEYF